MRGLFTLRVNFAIAFLGAFFLIFLIRLTALLPSQYYFSFSKLVAGDRGPFMVDPPSVTGAKLCDLLRANNISPETLQSSAVDCRVVREETEKTRGGQKFSAEAVDRIYAVALQSDTAIRDVIGKQLRVFSLAPLASQELEEAVSRSRTVNDAFENLRLAYNRQLENAFLQPLSDAYGKQLPNINPMERSAPTEMQFQMSDAEAGKIRAGNETFRARFNEAKNSIVLKPIQKSTVDSILNDSASSWDVPRSLSKFYVDQIEDVSRTKLREEFVAQQLEPVERKEARQLIFRQISTAGLNDYLISVGVRLLPVIVFGFFMGLIFGARELHSIALAAALAAFLLSWPLILMWDKLVSYQWQDQRPLFTLFYAVYILSFFVTARMSGLWGAGLRNLFVSDSTADGDDGVATVTSKEVLINIVAGLATNGLVYAWNVLLPLAGA
jgi:hypothetical protein